MSKFVLVDHSLVKLGGHHFEYAEHALLAADKAGLQVVVVGNKSFRKPAAWSTRWESHSLFPFTLYDELAAHGTDCDERAQEPVAGSSGIRSRFAWLSNWRTRLERRITRRQATAFARSLQQILNHVSLERGDHVYFPTTSIFDFHCIAEFLRDVPETQRAHWHFQFHYGPAVETGVAADRLRSSFTCAVRQLSQHSVRLYATTAGLANQIQSLGGFPCQELAHHVNPRFVPELMRNPSEPLRILCAGCPRHEKGYQHLSQITLDLWNDYFGAGRAQLCLQAKQSFLLPNRPRCRANLPGREPARSPRFQPVGHSADPVAYIRFPLPADDYVRMIRTADVGLFLYDPASYRHRCSGVFIEMLSAGIPVVVPGNCWMADQVREANLRCRERVPDGNERPGMVGLIAENPNETPSLIREILDHHPHYRAQAVAQSVGWRPRHSADATIETLTNVRPASALRPAA